MTSFDPSKLIGIALKDDWEIVSLNPRTSNATGAHHSYGYIAKNTRTGHTGFVKALKVERDTRIEDPEERLADLEIRIQRFRYERNLLRKCNEKNIKKVVKLILDDTLVCSDGTADIPYFLFELAVSDLRSRCNATDILDSVENLHILHQAFTAIEAMHFNNIVHQDIRPSNVLLFGTQTTKLGDLGNAHDKTIPRPGDSSIICGARGHAPVEQLYQKELVDWEERRTSADLYMLGSLIVYVFAGVSLTNLIQSHLLPEHGWLQWSGSYDDVMPFLTDAWDASLEELEVSVDKRIATEICLLTRSLTHPEPSKRGYPKPKPTVAKYSLRQYVSRLNVLEQRLKMNIKTEVIS